MSGRWALSAGGRPGSTGGRHRLPLSRLPSPARVGQLALELVHRVLGVVRGALGLAQRVLGLPRLAGGALGRFGAPNGVLALSVGRAVLPLLFALLPSPVRRRPLAPALRGLAAAHEPQLGARRGAGEDRTRAPRARW